LIDPPPPEAAQEERHSDHEKTVTTFTPILRYLVACVLCVSIYQGSFAAMGLMLVLVFGCCMYDVKVTLIRTPRRRSRTGSGLIAIQAELEDPICLLEEVDLLVNGGECLATWW
jgi:hypothetical protein